MSKKEVLILGAGFSRAVAGKSMPLLHELTKDINKKIICGDQEIRHIWQKYIVGPNIGNIKSVDTNTNNSNFEDIMTFLSSNFAYEDYKDEHLKAILYRYITDLIVEIFEKKNLEKELLHEPYVRNFCQYLHSERPDVFTFNYDLVLENLLYQNIPGASNVFDPMYSIKKMDLITSPFSSYEEEFWCNSLKIYKLHGSINWLYDPKFPNGIRITTTKTIPGYKQGLQTLLVPPSMLKNFVFNTKLLDFQWQMFRKKLNEITRLYVIGYSIPTTDVATRYAFQTQLNSKCRIFIITQDKSKTKQHEWEELFAIQNARNQLHIIDTGFNKESLEKIRII
ncbi:MAG: hypothetical protein J6Y25_00495 [Elusimicrobiaceae bacterium]|nr:hypothetical protein [Elusimicrobiaceae bacterium]